MAISPQLLGNSKATWQIRVNIDSDKTHGSSTYHTFFCNYASGYRRPFTNTLSGTVVDDLNNRPGGNGPLRAAGAMAYSYWMYYIGNALGTPGRTNGWVYDSGYMGTPSIFMLGWDDPSPYPIDANVAATAIRDSNYDYLTNRVHLDASDPNHTLPASLYLTPDSPDEMALGQLRAPISIGRSSL